MKEFVNVHFISFFVHEKSISPFPIMISKVSSLSQKMRRFVYVTLMMMINWFFLLLDNTSAVLHWRHELTRKLQDGWRLGPSLWPRDIPLVLPPMTGRWIITAPGAVVLRREKGEEIRKNFSNFFFLLRYMFRHMRLPESLDLVRACNMPTSWPRVMTQEKKNDDF